MYIFFINCIYCIVLIVYIVLARTCFNERFSLLNVAWLNKVLYCIVLYPTGSEISRLWYITTRGRKSLSKIFLGPYLSVHWGDLIEQIKKISHINFNTFVFYMRINSITALTSIVRLRISDQRLVPCYQDFL